MNHKGDSTCSSSFLQQRIRSREAAWNEEVVLISALGIAELLAPLRARGSRHRGSCCRGTQDQTPHVPDRVFINGGGSERGDGREGGELTCGGVWPRAIVITLGEGLAEGAALGE